jgi:RimJ/RimL family protein N-acetyltransferase
MEVRPFESSAEYEGMIDYFLGGDEVFLRGMGVEPAKLPARADWLSATLVDHERPEDQKERFYLAWYDADQLVGHSSISHIRLGEVANVHLHLWRADLRRTGLGMEFFARSIDAYFDRYSLPRLACEPYAENPAPNRTLEQLGFRLVERRTCVPTAIAFEQDVNRYEVTREEWAARRASVPR